MICQFKGDIVKPSQATPSPVSEAWTERAFIGICRPYIAEIRAVGRIEFMNAGAAQLADWDAKDAPDRPGAKVLRIVSARRQVPAFPPYPRKAGHRQEVERAGVA